MLGDSRRHTIKPSDAGENIVTTSLVKTQQETFEVPRMQTAPCKSHPAARGD